VGAARVGGVALEGGMLPQGPAATDAEEMASQVYVECTRSSYRTRQY
jgi:hypothetical protein